MAFRKGATAASMTGMAVAYGVQQQKRTEAAVGSGTLLIQIQLLLFVHIYFNNLGYFWGKKSDKCKSVASSSLESNFLV